MYDAKLTRLIIICITIAYIVTAGCCVLVQDRVAARKQVTDLLKKEATKQ